MQPSDQLTRFPWALMPLALLAPVVQAQSATDLGQVEVRAERDNASREREESTASKIVIGREELEQQGDATVGEVLKRQPGVTITGAPGRGGAIRMRGLGGGYTQILLDGERVPPGFDVTSLPPSQVQRIEIMRAPTAETGARAIAGTINIVMREGRKTQPDELKLSHTQEHAQGTQQLQWVHQLPSGPMPGSLTVSASSGSRADETYTYTSGTTGERWRDDVSTGQRRGLHVNGRFQWKGEGGKSLTLMPFVVYAESSGQGSSTVSDGSSTDSATQSRGSHFAMARLNSVWSQRLSADDKLELRLGAGQSRYGYRMDQTGGGTAWLPNMTQDQDFLDQSANLSGKWTRALDSGHQIVSGVEYEQVHRRETGNTAQVTEGGNVSASTQRWALYSQDEFTINRQWSAYGGLRYETILTQGETGELVRNRSSVWTPLLHAVFKPDPDKRDQIRMSLTRSYKSPSMYNLIGLYQQSTGENSPTNPDRSGNPNLRPELATGIDLTFERYLAQGGVLSATVFRRHVSDLIRYRVEDVGGLYVASPANVGKAMTQGLELEAKFRLDQWWAQAWPVDIRSNVSLFKSRVYGVPEPDNRLDRQPDMTANLGADYRMRSWPLTIGGNLNLNPAYSTRVSEQQISWVGAKRVLDVYGLWRINERTGLRLTLSNALGRDYVSSSRFDNGTVAETSTSTWPSWRSVQLRLEMKL